MEFSCASLYANDEASPQPIICVGFTILYVSGQAEFAQKWFVWCHPELGWKESVSDYEQHSQLCGQRRVGFMWLKTQDYLRRF